MPRMLGFIIRSDKILIRILTFIIFKKIDLFFIFFALA